MHQLAWVRLMVARHPWIYWLTIAVIACGIALSAAGAMSRVEAARRSWGRPQTVWIASGAMEPGDPILASARSVPAAVVPGGAVTKDPTGTSARQRLGPGEIVTTEDVTTSGSAGLIPDGWVAFAVAAAVEQFNTGDHLRVYAVDQLVAAGLVVDEGESELMVAVPAAAAPAMASALLTDTITLALTPFPHPLP